MATAARGAGGQAAGVFAAETARTDEGSGRRMAGIARHRQRRVIHLGAAPAIRVVAHIAGLRCRNMAGRLADFGDCTGAVVTGGARCRWRNLRVIEPLNGLP